MTFSTDSGAASGSVLVPFGSMSRLCRKQPVCLASGSAAGIAADRAALGSQVQCPATRPQASGENLMSSAAHSQRPAPSPAPAASHPQLTPRAPRSSGKEAGFPARRCAEAQHATCPSALAHPQATSTAPLPNSQPSGQTNHYLVGEKTQTQLLMGKNLPLLMLLLQPG